MISIGFEDSRRLARPDVQVSDPWEGQGRGGAAVAEPPIHLIPTEPVYYFIDNPVERHVEIRDETGRLITVIELLSPSNKEEHRSVVLHRILYLIYVGKRAQAWEFYDRAYKLDDKKEFRRRITNILNNQPVYKFIYNLRNRT